MRAKVIGASLLVVSMLAACDQGASPLPAAEETALANGTWSGVVTRIWSESVEQSGDGVHSLITIGGSGDLIDSHHISGSTTGPREGGEDTVMWDLTLTR